MARQPHQARGAAIRKVQGFDFDRIAQDLDGIPQRIWVFADGPVGGRTGNVIGPLHFHRMVLAHVLEASPGRLIDGRVNVAEVGRQGVDRPIQPGLNGLVNVVGELEGGVQHQDGIAGPGLDATDDVSNPQMESGGI